MKRIYMKRAKAFVVLSASALVAIALYAKTDGKRDLPNLKVDETPLKASIKQATSLAPMIKETSPSVVSIFSKRKVEFTHGNMDLNPFFRRFFEEQEIQPRSPRNRESEGVGSGVIVSSDGYILTNSHVVENSDEIEVQFSDGRTKYKAEIIGTDPNSDVAVIKIDATDLPAITMGDSAHLEVGDAVLAIGNPMNVGHTVTRGIVSALGREARMVNYENFIQTDAPINRGNSGGALIDAQGRLIGINTMIVSSSGGNNGIGFAIPVNMARNVMTQLIQHGEMIRGYLGVRLQEMDDELADTLGLDSLDGALAANVNPNTPAAKAGIKPGDVITQFNGKPIRDTRELRLRVSETAPGTESKVKVLRGGKNKQFTVVLEPFPEELRFASFDPRERRSAPQREESLEGVEVSDIERAVRRELNIPGDISGALVTDVDEDSPAFEAGLREGDVIQQIQHNDVESADDAIELSEEIDKDQILLRIWSKEQRGSRFIVVDESKKKD